MEIKFEYIYSNSKDFIKKVFTLEEISNGECYEYLSDMPMYKDYKIITYRQFTGLFDKEGKEIYEGDILELSQKSHLSIIGKVVFINGGFELRQIKGNRLWYFQDLIITEGFEFKVIGNVYQNSGFLDKNK